MNLKNLKDFLEFSDEFIKKYANEIQYYLKETEKPFILDHNYIYEDMYQSDIYEIKFCGLNNKNEYVFECLSKTSLCDMIYINKEKLTNYIINDNKIITNYNNSSDKQKQYDLLREKAFYQKKEINLIDHYVNDFKNFK